MRPKPIKYLVGEIIETEVCGTCKVLQIFKSTTSEDFAYEVQNSDGVRYIYLEEDLQ